MTDQNADIDRLIAALGLTELVRLSPELRALYHARLTETLAPLPEGLAPDSEPAFIAGHKRA
jgi:hypothetical protein